MVSAALQGVEEVDDHALAGLDLETVREVEDDPIGYPDKFWAQLAELGLLGMTLPEELRRADVYLPAVPTPPLSSVVICPSSTSSDRLTCNGCAFRR